MNWTTLLRMLQHYLSVVLKSRGIALSVALIACLVGWGIVYNLPNYYRSYATVYVNSQSLLAEVLDGLTPDARSVDQEFVNMARRTLITRPNLRSIIETTDLKLQVEGEFEMEGLIESLSNNILISAVSTDRRGTAQNLITIEYNHSNPALVYDVVEATLNLFVETVLSGNTADSRRTREFLDSEIAEYSDRLVEAEVRLAAFKRENVGFIPGESGNHFQQLERVEEQIRQAQRELMEQRSIQESLVAQIRSIESGKSDSGVPTQNPIEQEIQALEGELARALLTLTERHPDVIALQSRIEVLRNNLASGQTGDSNSLGGLYQNRVVEELRIALGKSSAVVRSLEARVTEYRQRQVELSQALDKGPQVEAQLLRLTRDYNIMKEQYDELVARRESADLSRKADASSGAGLFRVVEPPVVPRLPEGPNRFLFYTGVLIAGLGLGVGLIVGFEILRPTLSDLSNVAAVTGANYVGTVTRVPAASSFKRPTYLWLHLVMLGVLLLAYMGLVVTTLYPGLLA